MIHRRGHEGDETENVKAFFVPFVPSVVKT